MKTRFVSFFLPACILALFIVSCTPNGGSIFYTLEHEEKQPPSTLGESIDVFDVASQSGIYYAAAGSIFVGSTDAGGNVVWLPATKLDTLPQAGALCNALVAFQGSGPSMNLYGGFYTLSGNLGLYRASGADFTAGTAVLDPTATPRVQVIKLIAAGGATPTLLVITAVPNTDPSTNKATPFYYSLYSSLDGSTYTPLLTGVTVAINDAATPDGTNFYAVAGNSYYQGTSATIAASATSTLGSVTIASTDILYGVDVSGGTIYVTSMASGIYVYGGSWTNVAADTQNGTAVSYLGISGPVSGSAGSNILIGCEKYGYYYYDGTTLSRSADTNMITLKLYYAVIRKLVVVSGTNMVFACTQGNGLWKGVLDPANPSGVSGWTIQ
jgi:hypothetical protein